MSDNYVRALLIAYHALPDTPRRDSRHDRLLASSLDARGIPLHTVKAAFIVATARRTFRPLGSVPLGSIRSVAYFLPVVEELCDRPPRAEQLETLRARLAAAGVTLPV